jgi:hypothetical protein
MEHAGRILRSATLALLACLALGCFAHTVKTPIYDQNQIEVYLRNEEKGGKPVDRGFDQPIVIAPIRLANIFSRIEVREKKEEQKARRPAIPTTLVFGIGEGVAKALAKADSSQEVVVMAVERKRSHGIFTADFLTSLVVWMQDDRLYVHLGQLDWPIPRDPHAKIPEPHADKLTGDLRVVQGIGLNAEGPQTVAVDWRAPTFRSSSIRIKAGGGIVRRTILMESPEESGATMDPEAGEENLPPAFPELSPEALRALADLEEARQRGEVSEDEYRTRRNEILTSGTAP